MCVCVYFSLSKWHQIYFFFSSLLLPRAQAQLCSAITLYYCASTVTASLSNLFIEAHGLWSNVASSPTSTVVRAEEWVVPQSPFHQLQGKGGFRGCPYRPPAPGVSFSEGRAVSLWLHVSHRHWSFFFFFRSWVSHQSLPSIFRCEEPTSDHHTCSWCTAKLQAPARSTRALALSERSLACFPSFV